MLILNPGPVQAYPAGVQCLLDYPAAGVNVVKTYANMSNGATGNGTISTNSITASATITNLIQPGEKLRIGGTDIYTVATASGTAITTIETLTANYSGAALALDTMTKWMDTSGNLAHWTQSTLSAKPKFNPAQINSLAVAAFDGLNQLLGPSSLYTIPNGDNTHFMVIKRLTEAATSVRGFGYAQSGVATYASLGLSATAGQIFFNNGANITNTGNTNTNYQIVGCRRSGTLQGISVNHNTEVTNNSAVSSALTNIVTLGAVAGSNQLIGGIAKYVVFNRYLQDSEMLYMFQKLSAETGIAIS